jgi:hypothetical protein
VIEYTIRGIIRITVGLLLLCFALNAAGQYVTLTGQMQGANGLPASNNVISFEPSQMFFIPGTNTTQQVGNLYGNGAPTGTCAVSGQFYTNSSTTPPSLYQCIYGVWVYVGTQGSGTVTSVGISVPNWLTVSGSPVTNNGTITITGASETSNLFLASPSGSAGAMAPRAILSADLPPTIAANTTGNAATTTALASTPTLCATGYSPTGILPNGNATGCAASTGTVTSVGITVPSMLAVTPSTITSSGTFALTLASQPAYSVLNNATSSSNTPGFTDSPVVNNLTVLGTLSGGNVATGVLGTATSSANYNSQYLEAVGSYYNASSLPVADTWSFQNMLGSGTAPTSQLILTHSGSSGAASVLIPYSISVGNTITLNGLNSGIFIGTNDYWSEGSGLNVRDGIETSGGIVGAAGVSVGAVRRGTLTCTAGGTISVSNTNVASTSDITFTLKTPGGTISTVPSMQTITPGTGFTVLCGAADLSVYNYAIWN